jgi:hypothetical protein
MIFPKRYHNFIMLSKIVNVPINRYLGAESFVRGGDLGVEPADDGDRK